MLSGILLHYKVIFCMEPVRLIGISVSAPTVIIALVPAIFVVFGTISDASAEKLVIGAIEEVMLTHWRVVLPARIDTGAALSALDARDIVVKGGFAEFKLPPQYGGTSIRYPLVKKKRRIRATVGEERRPVVRVDLCIGTKKVRVDMTLTNRALMDFPLLIGRNALSKGFLVDVDQMFLHPPACPLSPPGEE